jgi:hypothetical protein
MKSTFDFKDFKTRSQDEILQFALKLKQDRFSCFDYLEVICYLDFEHAKEFLSTGSMDENTYTQMPYSRDLLFKYIQGSMEVALIRVSEESKFCQCTVANFIAWVWLLGDEEFYQELEKDFEEYSNLGRTILEKICLRYNLPYKDV